MDWKKTVATVAPTIATALGGPMAGVAVNVVAKALGIEPDESSVIEAMATGDPDVLMKLKEAEAELKVRLKELDVSLEQLHQKDRNSARSLSKIVGILPQGILSFIFVSGYFGSLYFIFGGGVVTADMNNMLHQLIGIMSAGMIQVMNFWFGSSSGSKQKTEKMNYGA